MALTAFFMLTLYPALLLWCSRPEVDLAHLEQEFDTGPPIDLDRVRQQRLAATTAFDELADWPATGSD